MSKTPSVAELAKTHLRLTEQLEALKLLDSAVLKRTIEVLKTNAPKGIVDPSSAHATIASYSKQEGYLAALTTLQNINLLVTVEDRLTQLTPAEVPSIFDPRD